ncbi:MAG: hypothetical protein ACRDAM_07945 [Casimicrobium sp.]
MKGNEMAKAAKIAHIALATLVAATRSETGFMFATPASVEPLIAFGDAEMNMEVVNPANETEFAVRATAKGLNATMSTENPTPAPAPSTKPVFTIETIDRPTVRRRGNSGASAYPFDALPAPDTNGKVSAFFIPATASKPEPWKSLQSAVSAATRKYATETGEKSFTKGDGTTGTRKTYDYTRKFAAVEGTREGVKGAWVSRLA